MNFPEDTKVKGFVVADMGGSGAATGVHAVSGRCRLMAIQWRGNGVPNLVAYDHSSIRFRDGSSDTDSIGYEMLLLAGTNSAAVWQSRPVGIVYLGGHGILFNDGIFINVQADPVVDVISIFYAGGGEPA